MLWCCEVIEWCLLITGTHTINATVFKFLWWYTYHQCHCIQVLVMVHIPSTPLYSSSCDGQTRGDSTFNDSDSDSDSDSSTPFRFRFRLRFQSSWLRFRLRFRLQHYFYERFQLRFRFNSDSSTPYILIVTPELYKFWFKYQPRCIQNV